MSPSEAHLNYITLHPVLPKKKIQLLNCCNLAGEANSMKYAIASSHFGRHWVKVQYVQKMLNTHKYRYSFSCIGPHTHTYIHRHRHSHTHSHTFMETQFHVHTHTHTHTRSHTSTHMHLHKNSGSHSHKWDNIWDLDHPASMCWNRWGSNPQYQIN